MIPPDPEAMSAGDMGSASTFEADVSVVVVVSEAAPLAACLAAIDEQTVAPREVIVAGDDRLGSDAAGLVGDHGAHLVRLAGMRTAEALRGPAAGRARGAVVALTESHCRPAPGWLQTLLESYEPGVAAVGGTVEHAAEGAGLADWAFHFCDYHWFQVPQSDRDVPNLTDCNVSYDRGRLDSLGTAWRSSFHVWSVNDRLRAGGQRLRLAGHAVVWQRRTVPPAEAMRESFAHGRLFARRRLVGASGARRWMYAAGGGLVAPLLLGRMCRRVVATGRHLGWFVAALPWIVLYTTSWSSGELLGYIGGALFGGSKDPQPAL